MALADDPNIFRALQNRELWPQPRAFTGAGECLVRTTEIAQVLSLDYAEVIESLERLEAQGRVRHTPGTMDNPDPQWHILPQ